MSNLVTMTDLSEGTDGGLSLLERARTRPSVTVAWPELSVEHLAGISVSCLMVENSFSEGADECSASTGATVGTPVFGSNSAST